MLEKLTDIPAEFWHVLTDMSPYLLFGFLVAGILSVMISSRLIERHLGGRGFWQVVKAAAIGVPLPLCSCGVIPVSASLRRHGAGKGATTSFLISTPQTGVDSILVTFSLLGPVYAVFRPLLALATGIVGGGLVDLADREPAHAHSEQEKADTHAEQSARTGNRAVEALKYGFGTLPRDIGRELLVGLLIAAALTALIPENYFAEYLGGGIVAILALMALGIPVYVCATASVPVAAALIVAGASPGAALAFLMTGPATNAATIATIWKVMGKRTATIYLLTMAVGAVGGGLLLDQLVTPQQVQQAAAMGWMLPPLVGHVSAVALLGLLVWASAAPLIKKLRGGKPAEMEGERTTIAVTGMTCEHCVGSVRKALLACEGVTDAQVDLMKNQATVAGEGYDVAKLLDAIREIGYDAERRE